MTGHLLSARRMRAVLLSVDTGNAAAGRRQDALGAITDLQKLAGERYVSPYAFALVYAGLRETNSAISYLR